MDKKPFSLTADLEFLYLSEAHMRVYEEILSAIHRRDGLICVTGGPGTGKTVICKRLLEELSDEYNVVLVNTPPKTAEDMTQTLDDAFAEMEGNSKIPVAIFDEAQHLDFRCLDHVKFLTNLEKDGGKLLQIILVGQPELADKLSHKRFAQLEQRIGAKLRLGSLKKKEVLAYLNHRLSVAGLSEALRFTNRSARTFYKMTSGIPRLINRIANIAVDQALKEERAKVGGAVVRRAASKVSATRGGWAEEKRPRHLSGRLSVLLFLFASAVGLYLYYYDKNLEWRFPFAGGRIAETQTLPLPPRFALKVGAFFKREDAEAFREQLAEQGFPSIIVTKDLGEGWNLFQVRLRGTLNQAEADNQMDRLRSKGILSVEKIQVKPSPQ